MQENCLAFYFIRVEWFIEPEVVDFVIKRLESVDQEVLAHFVVCDIEYVIFLRKCPIHQIYPPSTYFQIVGTSEPIFFKMFDLKAFFWGFLGLNFQL